MSKKIKFDSKELEDFYEKNIKPMVKPGYFPSYKELFEKGFIAFYIALAYGKTDKYPSIQSFCDHYGLKRQTAMKSKWDKDNIDKFYLNNIKPYTKNNKFPVTSWFKKKGGEYWGFICVLNAGKVKGYVNVKDFKEKNLLHSKGKKFLNKTEVDSFYVKEVKKYITNNKLPSTIWFRKKGGILLSWYTFISRPESGYKGAIDFSKKNNLEIPTRKIWNKKNVDEMFKEKIIPLMDGKKLIPYSKFKELNGKYLEWYNALRNNRVDGYSGIKDFKKKNKLT